jgi:hypothetical protein
MPHLYQTARSFLQFRGVVNPVVTVAVNNAILIEGFDTILVGDDLHHDPGFISEHSCRDRRPVNEVTDIKSCLGHDWRIITQFHFSSIDFLQTA